MMGVHPRELRVLESRLAAVMADHMSEMNRRVQRLVDSNAIDELTEKVVLHVRDGRLFVQTAQPVLAGERPVAPKTAVSLGTHMKAGPVSFVVTRP